LNKINFDHINACKRQDDFRETCKELFDANPDVFHFFGRKALAQIEQARYTFAGNLNVLPSELYFSGSSLMQSTDLINYLILFSEIKTVYTSIFEPKAFINHLKLLEKENAIKLCFIETGSLGALNLDRLKNQFSETPETSLLYLSHANEYSGLLLPVKEIVKICKENNVLFHLNLKPTIGKYKIDLAVLSPDFASVDLSEYCGGHNAGVFYMKQNLEVSDKIFHLLKKSFEGNENKDVFSICRMEQAYKYTEEYLPDNFEIISSIRKYFIEQFDAKLGLKHIAAGYHKEGIYTLLTYFFPETGFGNLLAEKLDIEHIACAKMDYPHKKEKGTFLRFSFGKENTCEEIDKLVAVLKNIRV